MEKALNYETGVPGEWETLHFQTMSQSQVPGHQVSRDTISPIAGTRDQIRLLASSLPRQILP